MPSPDGRSARPPAVPDKSAAPGGAAARLPFFTAGAVPAAVPPPARSAAATASDALAAAGLGAYDFDLVTGEAHWSPEALAIYGGFPGRPTAVQLRARVHPADWPKLYAVRTMAEVRARAELAETGRPPGPVPVDLPHRVVRPDGAVRRVRALGEYRFGPDGTPWRSVGVLRDETDQAPPADPHDPAALADRRGRALLAAELGTFDYDAASDRVTWDERTKIVFGEPAVGPDHRPLGRVLAAIHPDDRADARARIEAALNPATGGHFQASHRIVRPDGTVRRIAARADVFFAAAGGGRRAVRTVGVIEDVTESVIEGVTARPR